jgi:hypothetical protein
VLLRPTPIDELDEVIHIVYAFLGVWNSHPANWGTKWFEVSDNHIESAIANSIFPPLGVEYLVISHKQVRSEGGS